MLLCYFLTILYLHNAKVVLDRASNLSNQHKILGTSKIGPKYRVTLIKSVQEKLKAKVGDAIIFLEDADGNIVMKVVRYDQIVRDM